MELLGELLGYFFLICLQADSIVFLSIFFPMDTRIRPERFPSKQYKDFRSWRENFTRVATASGWTDRQMIPYSLGSGPPEVYTILRASQREGKGVTGANMLSALETRFVPYATQQRLTQDFKLATQEDNESIREWGR